MGANEQAEECPIVLKFINEENHLDLARHMIQLCFHCLRKRLQEKFGGKKLLYTDRPPPWIDEAEKTIPNEGGHNSEQSARAPKKRKQDIRTVIPKEEVDEHLYKRSFELSDAQLTYEIVKLKKLSKEAALAFMIKLRQRAKAEKGGIAKTDEAKQKVNPHELPWCPSLQSLFPRGFVSVLSQREQLRFLGICQNILNACSLRFMHNLKEIKDFQKKVSHEREHMTSLLLDMIEENLEDGTSVPKNHPLTFLHRSAPDFVLKRWEKRWLDKTFQSNFAFSDCISSIEWNIRSIRRDSEIRPKLVSTILKGRCDEIEFPDLHHRCKLNPSNLHADFPIQKSYENIFDDVESVTSICLQNDVRIAMDATTACHLMCDPFVGHNYSYAIPIRVIQKVNQGTLTNIAILGKPRVLSAVEPATIQRQYIKYLLKARYVHKQSGAAPDNPDICEPLAKKRRASQEQGDVCSPLDSILPSMDQPSNHRNSRLRTHTENCKNYSVFSIIGSNILVRSRPPPLCSGGRKALEKATLSFQPRVEYVPNAGAMRLSEAESMWNYCKGLFKQSANHALFRTHYSCRDLLQVQHWGTESFMDITGPEQLWTGPASKQDTVQMIANGTSRFSRLLGAIGRFVHGDYMLVNKNDGSIQILSQVGDSAEGSDVLKCGRRKICVSQEGIQFSDAFNGLESLIPLQWQVVQKRAPGCYVAPDSNLKSIAHAPLPDGSFLAEYANRKRRAKKRKRQKKKNVTNHEQLPEPSYIPLPAVEVEGQMACFPFGNLTAPNSPAHSTASLSPCHTPQYIVD